jgi:dihydrodipicolinate synthase/N-acetylneuraminate lyase
MLLQGIFPPITTPFYADGRVYFKKLESNVERYSRSPVSGLVVLGSTGEAILLSEQERRDVLRSARQAASPEKVLLAGTGCESALETLRLTEYAAELGYDVAMVRTPHYYKAQIEQPQNMLAFYRFVADRSPLPVLLYNFPQATAYDIPADVVVALAAHPNVIGLKEANASLDKLRLMVEGAAHVRRTVQVTDTFQAVTPRMVQAAAEGGLKVRGKEVGFQILVGSANRFFDLLQAGAVGGILSFADAAPTAMYEIYAAWKEGGQELAEEKQKRLALAAARVGGDLGIPGVKYACDLNGYYGGPVRLPLLPLTAEVRAEVEQLMASVPN